MTLCGLAGPQTMPQSSPVFPTPIQPTSLRRCTTRSSATSKSHPTIARCGRPSGGTLSTTGLFTVPIGDGQSHKTIRQPKWNFGESGEGNFGLTIDCGQHAEGAVGAG